MAISIEKVIVGQLDVNCYIVSGGLGPEAIIIDPGDEAERIIGQVRAAGLAPACIAFTHAHYDHVCAAGELREAFQAPVAMHADDTDTYRRTKDLCVSWGYEPGDFPEPDMQVRDGDHISAGALRLEVIHTPGHTPGCICLLGPGVVFTGDTLFRGSVGRTDLPGGDAKLLMKSLKRLAALPAVTRVFSGHGPETAIGQEMEGNPYLSSRSRLKFFG